MKIAASRSLKVGPLEADSDPLGEFGSETPDEDVSLPEPAARPISFAKPVLPAPPPEPLAAAGPAVSVAAAPAVAITPVVVPAPAEKTEPVPAAVVQARMGERVEAAPLAAPSFDSPVDAAEVPVTPRRASRHHASTAAALTARLTTSLRRNWLVWALAAVVLIQAPVVVLWMMNGRLPFTASTGTVQLESTPPGAQVSMDGTPLGVTPLSLSLEPGDRVLDVQHGDVTRQLTLNVSAGSVIQQRIEFLGTAPVAAALGSLSVTTEPGRAPVTVDGVDRGMSPVVVSDLATGDHTVNVRFATGTVTRTIRVESGATAQLVATMPAAAGAVSGWLTVTVPQTLQIFEQGRLIGSTDFTRLMLPAGEHALEFVHEELGFRVRRAVRINPGATTPVQVELPTAPLSINAQPWASVWLDGQPVGDTPIGNLSPTIGQHEVVFRHPELGERRMSILVTLKTPARISVDLRR